MSIDMENEIEKYNQQAGFSESEQAICQTLFSIIQQHMLDAEYKIWHAHPVWFLDGNPIVGYSKQKRGIRLMFWSGDSFGDETLNIRGEKFKDASIFYNSPEEIDRNKINSWLNMSREFQWDYKNVIKRKGKLERLK
jgi:hypothetical protein